MTVPKVIMKKAKPGEKAFHSLGTIEQTLKKGPLFPILIVASAIMYFITLILSGFAANPQISHGIFDHSIGNVSKMFPLNITPAGWTFSIWGIIYLSQIVSTLYALGLLCRHTDKGTAYLNPPVLSPVYFVFFSLSSIFVSGWLFLWDKLMFLSSTVFLLCCVTCLWMAFSIALERLSFFRSELNESGRSLDVNVINIFVINGIGMYATWSVIATLLNMGVVLVYRLGRPLPNETASIIALSIFALFILTYTILDMKVYEHINRFTFTPYLTIIWAFSGVISKNWNANSVSSIMAAVLLAYGIVTLLVKLGLSISRHLSYNNPYRRMKVAAPMN